MSVQRWSLWQRHEDGESFGVMKPENTGQYVLFSDFEAAVAEAYQRGREDAKKRSGYDWGRADAAADAGKVPHDWYCASRDENFKKRCNCPVDDAVAAARGEVSE